MNRLKVLLLVVIVAILATVFIQNREPIALKLLCEDPNSQYCFYQTPQIPLAIWMSLFLLGGVITNLLAQVFSRYSYTRGSKKRSVQDDLYAESQKNWVDRDTPSRKYSTDSVEEEDFNNQSNNTTAYEVEQEPESVKRSGSNYSYTYRTTERDQKDQDKNNNTSIDLDKNANLTADSEDEEWI